MFDIVKNLFQAAIRIKIHHLQKGQMDSYSIYYGNDFRGMSTDRDLATHYLSLCVIDKYGDYKCYILWRGVDLVVAIPLSAAFARDGVT